MNNNAGNAGFFTLTGFGTDFAKGKACREINGINYVREHPTFSDRALIKAERGDRWSNLMYRMAARKFGQVKATACKKR